MIKFQFSIKNYFPYTPNIKQIDYFEFDRKISNNRALAIQLTKWSKSELLKFLLDLNWKYSDHAGPRIEIEILGLFFNIELYNIHHWNYEENRWYKKDENESY